MATSLALKRIAASRFLNPIRTTLVFPSASRSFNTNAQMMTHGDEDDYDRSIDDVSGRRHNRAVSHGGFFSGGIRRGWYCEEDEDALQLRVTMPDGIHKGWDVKEDENALHLRVYMPGLSKEDVKISVEKNTMVIRGEGERDSDKEKEGMRYSSKVELSMELYKVDGIKAEMKNGVLKVVLPKVKEEDRKDVIQVNVE